MHLAEGILPMPQVLGWSAVALPALIWSIRGEQLEQKENHSSSTMIASVTSLLFAATLLPLPVPIIGATSHICLTPILALIIGLRRIIWPTFFCSTPTSYFLCTWWDNNVGYQYAFSRFVWSYCHHWHLECADKIRKKQHNWLGNCLWCWWLKCLSY